MTRSVGWIAVIAIGGGIWATAAEAQRVLPQVRMTSDFDAPYVDVPSPPRIYGPRYGGPEYDEPRYAPAVLPPTAIYGILRQIGFSPLGIPQQRGFVYTISVINPDGDDGRLVIDARTGRILRFLPAYRMGDRMSEEIAVAYGPAGPPPVAALPGAPHTPAAVPRVASRTPNVPLPKPMPRAVAAPKDALAKTAAPTKPADAQASVAAPVAVNPPAVIEAKPAAPGVQPTQDLPAAQGLE